MKRLAILLIGAPLVGGCIDTDAAVFVETTISEPTATAQSNALASGLGGSFEVKFHLGSRASGDSEVTLRSVSVSNADRSQTLAQALKVATAPAFPVNVPRGGDSFVTVSYSADDNLFEPDALTALCDPAGIVVSLNFDDGLLGATGVASSQPFTVLNCP